MRPGITMALIASLSLVGWATWYRVISSNKPINNLVAIETSKVAQAAYDELISKYLQAPTNPRTNTGSLTTTDLVGRQLIMDYLSLAENGQATDANLAALATKYIEGIPTVLATPAVSGLELKVVSNEARNFQLYASELEGMYQSYATSLLGSAKGKISLDSAGAKMFTKMGEIYTDAAETLKRISVPAALAEDHLALINVYLKNASAVRALAAFNTDPASSFAGLLSYKTNTDKEAETITKIENVLTEHGI